MLRSIQVLRALAAIAVVIEHADRSRVLGAAAGKGAAGVDLFFVISGFIMATTAAGKSPRTFIADRLWRIVPLWLIALAPWLAARHGDWRMTATSLTLWPIWGNQLSMPALWVGWSLCFEMLFYAAFALGLARRAALPLAIFAACLVAAPFSGSALLAYLGSPLILEFLAGMAIARLPVNEKAAPLLLIVGTAWLIAAPADCGTNVYGDAAFLRVLAWGVPAALIVFSVRSLEDRFGKAFDVPVQLGHASYAIYLFHPLLIAAGLSLSPTVGLSLLLGLAVHRAIERPLLALRSGRRSATRGTAQLAPLGG